MGFDAPKGSTKEQREAFEKNRDAEYKRVRSLEEKREQDRRNAQATNIVNAIVHAITVEIIRPGPKPEERECTTVAAEIEALKPKLCALIAERV